MNIFIRHKNALISVIVTISIIVLVVVQLRGNKEKSEQRVYHHDKDSVINVQANKLKLENITNDFSHAGTFESNRDTKISAASQGTIATIYIDNGSIVKKGQALVQLDNSLLNLQLRSVDVQIEGLEADVNRYTVLAKADAVQGVQLEKAILGLKSAKVQRNTLLEQISKTTIRAPFNGIVTAKLSEEGSFASPGAPLVQITDISMLKFTINVSEGDLNQFSLNQLYKIIVDAYPEMALHGKAYLIGSKGNISNSFPVQFLVKNTADLRIKSGMFGKVILEQKKEERHIVISASSIVGSSLKPEVYLVKDGKAVLRQISILRRIGNKVVVGKELSAGDTVITGGFINLYDNANVLITGQVDK